MLGARQRIVNGTGNVNKAERSEQCDIERRKADLVELCVLDRRTGEVAWLRKPCSATLFPIIAFGISCDSVTKAILSTYLEIKACK